MPKIIHGWNDIPEGYVQEEDFHLAPFWLRVVASVKYFEKYAYPIAIKKGLIKRWKIKPDTSGPEFSWAEGIQYINAQYPGLKHAEPIEIELKRNNLKIPVALMRIYSIMHMIKTITGAFFGGLFSTRWSLSRKSSYVKSKIEASKNRI